MFILGRRAFLLIVASCAAALRLRAQAPAAPRVSTSLGDFLDLSQRLLGRSKLDPDVAQIYLNALNADVDTAVHLATLAQSNGNPTAEQSVVARTIIEWWYTGVYTIGTERRVATHTGALMWSVLGRPAPGTCHGRFGDWSQPPRAIG